MLGERVPWPLRDKNVIGQRPVVHAQEANREIWENVKDTHVEKFGDATGRFENFLGFHWVHIEKSWQTTVSGRRTDIRSSQALLPLTFRRSTVFHQPSGSSGKC